MKEYPKRFNSEMVRATLDGRKTQTREVIKPQPKIGQYQTELKKCICDTYQWRSVAPFYAPYQVGDRLWVKETIKRNIEHSNFYYSADNKGVGVECYQLLRIREKPYPKTISSKSMPKFLARIWLEITNIKVERVQDASNKDANAEGMRGLNSRWTINDKPRSCFGTFWDLINKKHGYGWDKNPWVWVIEFKVLEQ